MTGVVGKSANGTLQDETANESLVGNGRINDGNSTGEKQSINPQHQTKTTKTKIIQTLVIYLSVFDAALVSCMIGPSLLDLEQLTNSDTATIATVFIARGVGALAGNVLAGFIIEKINYWLLISVDKLFSGLFFILIPLCRNVPLLVTCAIPAGIMHGFSVAGCCTVILFIWGKDNASAIQGYHFLFGVGCMLSPLVIEPFLLKKSPNSGGFNTSSLFDNGSEHVTARVENQFSYLTERSDLEEGSKSQIFYGYLIPGSFAFLTCVCAFILFLKSGRRVVTYRKNTNVKNEISSNEERTRLGLLILFFVLLFTFCVCIIALEKSITGFLMTFAVKQFGWSKRHGAILTSLYIGAFTLGRGTGIFVTKCVSPTLLLFIDLFICIVFSLVMVIFVNMHWSVIWICVTGLGIGISTMLGLGFTWTERQIGVNPNVTSIIMVGAAFGDMGAPVVVGLLFDKVAMMSFTYVLLGYSFISLLLMVALQFTARKVKAGFNHVESEESI